MRPPLQALEYQAVYLPRGEASAGPSAAAPATGSPAVGEGETSAGADEEAGSKGTYLHQLRAMAGSDDEDDDLSGSFGRPRSSASLKPVFQVRPAVRRQGYLCSGAVRAFVAAGSDEGDRTTSHVIHGAKQATGCIGCILSFALLRPGECWLPGETFRHAWDSGSQRGAAQVT